jgi:ATP-dependent helicase/nuclease subunit B
MVRAVLRPFSAVVWPGVDARQLAPPVPMRHLLGQQEEALGLATAEQLSQAQWQAFALLAAHPEVHAICRSSVDGEPVEASAWLKRWAIEQAGPCVDKVVHVPPHGWPLQDAPHVEVRVAHHAKARSAPSALTPLLPSKMSPSGYERLRSCPYRYYVSDILGIKSVQALEEGLAKNDYGTWLHEVLKCFHEQDMQATTPASAAQHLATLLSLADEVAVKQGMLTPEKEAAFALRRSAVTSVLAAYADWHHTQVQAGWQTQGVEQTYALDLTFDLKVALPSHADTTVPATTIRLYGQLDRVDRLRIDGASQWRVIDYKTSSASSLSSKVRVPLEDTQLAFYAALLNQWSDAIEAFYLSLEREVKAVAHADVKDSAQQLLDGLRDDLTRIHQGHALPALGEGQVCDFCDARGICRKDHWATEVELA